MRATKLFTLFGILILTFSSLTGCSKVRTFISTKDFSIKLDSDVVIERDGATYNEGALDVVRFSLSIRNKTRKDMTVDLKTSIRPQVSPALSESFALLKETPGPQLLILKPREKKSVFLQYATLSGALEKRSRYTILNPKKFDRFDTGLLLMFNHPLDGEISIPKYRIKEKGPSSLTAILDKYFAPIIALGVAGVIFYFCALILRGLLVKPNK